MAARCRTNGLLGARSLLLVQAIAAVSLGALLFVSPAETMTNLAMWLGLFWLLRCYVTTMHTLFVQPHRWAGRGLVAVLHLTGAVMVFQIPAMGLFEIGPAVVLFLGFQAIVAGSLELVLAARSGAHTSAFLGLTNVGVGGLLAVPVIAGLGVVSVTAMAWVTVVGGALAMYCAVILPAPRRRQRQWRLQRR